jgi:hypothetical protein
VLQANGDPYTAFNMSGYWCATPSDPYGSNAISAAATTTGDVYLAVNPVNSTNGYVNHFTRTGVLSKAWGSQTLTNVFLAGAYVDPSDSLILTGQYSASGSDQFWAQRYLSSSTGAADPSFLDGGGAFGNTKYLYTQASAMDADAGVYLGGSGTITGQAPVLGHVSASGSADLGGDAGWVNVGFNVQGSIGFLGIGVQSDGNLLGVGTGYDMMGNLPFVARMTPAGALDATFNSDGGAQAGYYLVTSTVGVTYNAVAAAPFPDGRIVIVGNDPAGGMFFLRIWP